MPLKPKQKQYLRKLAHNKKPVVMVGNAGLTEAVMNEIELSIAHHELMKIKVHAENKQARTEMLEKICQETQSELVFDIGNIATLYRKADRPVIQIPKD